VTDTRSERLLWPHGNPGATIYGTLVAAALLATEAAGSETVPAMVITILGTLIVYWLAHVYADVIARQALSEGEDPHRLTIRIVGEALIQELGVMIGGALLVVVLVVVSLAGAGRSVAVDAAQLCSIAQLVVWGVFAARRAHLRPVWVVLYALVSAALGVLIGLLKVALH
jgi:hypothetical protein